MEHQDVWHIFKSNSNESFSHYNTDYLIKSMINNALRSYKSRFQSNVQSYSENDSIVFVPGQSHPALTQLNATQLNSTQLKVSP